jgi:hypothetical protein
MPVDPGMHMVEARSEGYERFEKKLTVQEGAELEVVVDMTVLPEGADVENPYAGATSAQSSSPEKDEEPAEEKEGTNLLPFIVGGAGVASLAASGVFFVLRQGAISELEDNCGSEGSVCDDRYQSTADRGQLYSVLAPITLGVGIAGVGAGAVLFFMDRSKASDSQATGVRFAPGAPGAHAGASLLGRF